MVLLDGGEKKFSQRIENPRRRRFRQQCFDGGRVDDRDRHRVEL